ncbi:MAG: helix-turn-helix transcriptional regulator [Candidatus Thiodiazotropha sp.]
MPQNIEIDDQCVSEKSPLPRLKKIIDKRAKHDTKFREHYNNAALVIEVANKIRNARVQKNMTQQELAKQLGVTQPFVSRLENPNAKKHPDLKTLNRVAEVLDKKLTIEFS